ncbi:hypothetical protein PDIDSM_3904 [Penicillium digitatum]|nr:hypothetical protein PDIDSM_3904 [Penicillium digitatum]
MTPPLAHLHASREPLATWPPTLLATMVFPAHAPSHLPPAICLVHAVPRSPSPAPPLQILPTPHMLTDDSLMSAMEFAPGNGIKDRRAGRPETPTGGVRPYIPGARVHTPLASAFDELAVMPSAHALRKSGTFNNLDFVPPPRFKNEGGVGSDAGSIRSGRTAVSAKHQNNIRMGNYRVSRLPAEAVGTKDDMMASLRPKWGMNNG